MPKAVWGNMMGSTKDAVVVSIPSSPKKKSFEVSPSIGFAVVAKTLLKSMFMSKANAAPWCECIALLMA
jgi:hypothetical protein|tara:strand:- start:5396 stop:5602 length:207 start_codon:yes stop_codon:yes gene_type:complete